MQPQQLDKYIYIVWPCCAVCSVFRALCVHERFRSGFFFVCLCLSCVCMCVRAECAGLLRFDVFTLSSVSDPYSLWRMRNDGEHDGDVVQYIQNNEGKTSIYAAVLEEEKNTSR